MLVSCGDIETHCWADHQTSAGSTPWQCTHSYLACMILGLGLLGAYALRLHARTHARIQLLCSHCVAWAPQNQSKCRSTYRPVHRPHTHTHTGKCNLLFRICSKWTKDFNALQLRIAHVVRIGARQRQRDIWMFAHVWWAFWCTKHQAFQMFIQHSVRSAKCTDRTAKHQFSLFNSVMNSILCRVVSCVLCGSVYLI